SFVSEILHIQQIHPLIPNQTTNQHPSRHPLLQNEALTSEKNLPNANNDPIRAVRYGYKTLIYIVCNNASKDMRFLPPPRMPTMPSSANASEHCWHPWRRYKSHILLGIVANDVNNYYKNHKW